MVRWKVVQMHNADYDVDLNTELVLRRWIDRQAGKWSGQVSANGMRNKQCEDQTKIGSMD